jgi:hypothetical protein
LVPARADFAMVFFFCFVIVDSVRCIVGPMPATHARFLRPHSQANSPIMALRRWPPLDTSMASRTRRPHRKLEPNFPSPSAGSSSTEWRALPSEGRGREFESRRVRQIARLTL